MKNTASQYQWAEDFNRRLLARGICIIYFPIEGKLSIQHGEKGGITPALYNELYENRSAFRRYLASLQFSKET